MRKQKMEDITTKLEENIPQLLSAIIEKKVLHKDTPW